jgi:hypothetical protein
VQTFFLALIVNLAYADPTQVEPSDLIQVLESIGIFTCAIMSVGGDASADGISRSLLWTDRSGEG